VGALANILAIHDKLMSLISRETHSKCPEGTKVLLQGPHGESLNWSDSALTFFLEKTIPAKFGVLISRKNIKTTINGSWPTIGDLSIAIFTAINRQHKPKKISFDKPSARSRSNSVVVK
jgi:hypothetical protein